MVVAGHVKTGLNIKEIIVSPFLRISENCLLKQSANLFPMIESYIIKKKFRILKPTFLLCLDIHPASSPVGICSVS